MSQDSFVYSFVAKGIVILAEYTEFTGNFPAIANQCLQKLPFINNKYTYNCDHCTYHFLLEDGYVYCVVAKESLSKQISTAFLERVREDFKTRYGGGKADTDVAESPNKDFGPIMKDHMRYIIEHAEEIEELIKVKAQASEVKSKMSEDIEKILSKHMCCRYTLSSETGQAQDFRVQGTRLRRKMRYKNMKKKLAVLGTLLILVLIIWLSVSRGFSYSTSKD